MRLMVYLLGALSGMALVLTFLFKSLHLPGGDELQVFGLTVLALLFIPLFTIYKYRKGRTS